MPARCLGDCRKRHQPETDRRAERGIQRSLFTHIRRAGAAHGDPMKSAVARIAINICRIIGIVALMRSLEALLMATDGIGRTAAEKPADDLVKALKSCPGLLPSPHIPHENVQDGVVPQFDLTVNSDDFMPSCHSRNLCICIRVISCRSFRRAIPCSRKRRRRHSWICCLSTSPVAGSSSG